MPWLSKFSIPVLLTLLQVTLGFGLPSAEQLNVAVCFSVTVSDAGDTFISGAKIDSPGSPLGPGFPGKPVSPYKKKEVKKFRS